MNVAVPSIGHNGGPPLVESDDPALRQLYLNEKVLPLFEPYRHKALYGGRGSKKSHTIAEALTLITSRVTKRVVCGRQFQNSIKDSVKELLESKMRFLGMADPKFGFKFYEREIVHMRTESRYTFIGLDRNPDSAKSLEGADIFWGEEAHTFKTRSLEIIIPTIRKPGSEMWWSWNPEKREDPVDAYFRGGDRPANTFLLELNYQDNPYFLRTALPAEMEHMKRGNPARYRHIWLGDYDDSYETKVFSNVEIGRPESIPEYCVPRYGMDFGYGQDPSFIVKIYVIEPLKVVYIAREAQGRVPMRDLPAMIDSVINDRSDFIRADSSQPIIIEHLQSQGFNIHPAVKGPGSVKAGVNWLQSYKIMIDPDCEYMREEARLYSWQVDKLTKKALNVPVDAHNHGWDASRYAVEDIMRSATDDASNGGSLRIKF